MMAPGLAAIIKRGRAPRRRSLAIARPWMNFATIVAGRVSRAKLTPALRLVTQLARLMTVVAAE